MTLRLCGLGWSIGNGGNSATRCRVGGGRTSLLLGESHGLILWSVNLISVSRRNRFSVSLSRSVDGLVGFLGFCSWLFGFI